jgi:heme-degrading monooxygenase HmoA
MTTHSPGTVAIIFIAQRTAGDDAEYQAAASAMAVLATEQPGYVGVDSVRGTDGLGITISYWNSEEAAKAWRDNAEHAEIREKGRNRWYIYYDLHIAHISRSYDWVKPE